MRKAILKMIVFFAVFVASLFIIGKIMNKDHDNLTVETQPASLPLLVMERDGQLYNELHGYTLPQDVRFQRETVTVLGENRNVNFNISTYGTKVDSIAVEVRSIDGSRLIENTPLEDFEEKSGKIRCKVTLKDLLEAGLEYSLTVNLGLEDGRTVRYYTTIMQASKLYLEEKLDFVLDFHERTFDFEAAQEITKYLETSSKLESNNSFHRVNIHSSLRQVTWGDLGVRQVGDTKVQLTAIDGSTASFLLDFLVTNPESEESVTYSVREFYRIKYTADRTYLLSYDRTMTQIPVTDKLYVNDKLILGIADEAVDMAESEDGNIVVFQIAGRLYAYNVTANKLITVFSFYDDEDYDSRTMYDRHAIRILNVTEGGDIRFAVYGYMNRGRHEGETGLLVVDYSGRKNTVEELIYIPSDKPYSVLAAELDNLLYTNGSNKLYFEMNKRVYCVDLDEHTAQVLLSEQGDGMLHVSSDYRTLVWADGADIYHSSKLTVTDLELENGGVISVKADEAIMPLGFMEDDIIYGVAARSDVVKEPSGNYFFPMYKICICDATGALLKEYRQEGIYVTECSIEANQITLTCLQRLENGKFKETVPDHITNNTEAAVMKNKVVATDIDIYKRYVQLQVKKNIDAKTIKLLNPKEVVFELEREIDLKSENRDNLFYAFGPAGAEQVYFSEGAAVQRASDLNGMVLDAQGIVVWRKETRAAKNQIMAIKEMRVSGEQTSLGVCLDAMLAFKGAMANTEELLLAGDSAVDVLEKKLGATRVLDLSGASLQAVLYYVDHEIPVLALLNDGNAVLITGFNEKNVVIMNPADGTLAKKGMNDATSLFEDNGNCFIAYIP